MSVGAANYANTPGYGVSPARLTTYSSWGNPTLYFDQDWDRLETPVVRLPVHVACWGFTMRQLAPLCVWNEPSLALI